MRSIFKKLWKLAAHVQVLSVIMAFALMVFFSYYFMSGNERRHLLRNVSNVMQNVQTYLEADLMEPETTLGVISENIKNMIINGVSYRFVQTYLSQTTDFLTTDERLMSYATAVYGYFFIYGDVFFSGSNWIPPDDFVPQDRPWYISAIEADGKVGVTEPYVDVALGHTVLTFSRLISDNEDRWLGIICLNITIDRLFEYVINTHVTDDSYGILLDKQFNILAHPHPAFIGRHLSQINDGSVIQRELMQGNYVSEANTRDYNGQPSVLFAKQLTNGWYMAVFAHAGNYYKSLTNMLSILVLLGFIFAAGLSAMLLSITIAKKRAENRTRIMLDATPFCANFWDQNYNIIDCNRETLKLFNLSSKKDYISRFSDFSPEYQQDGRLSAEKSNELIKKAFDEGYCRFEWLHRTLSGELIPCEITLVRVVNNKEIIVCGYTRDLREIKDMMAKMREADECTQILFDATPLSCFMIDNTLNILECNQEVVRLFKLSDKREYINNIDMFFPKYQPSGQISRDFVIKHIDEAFEEGYCRFELMHQKPNGGQIPTEVTLVRVKFRGEYAVAGYIRDLSELKNMIAEMHRAEIAEESSKAKSDFLAKMSHEIRTPMNAILGIAEIQLQDSTLPLIIREALERIYNSGDLLLGIINDILDLSKIEAGKFELLTAQYDIASLIHDTVKLNILRYESKPVNFKLIVNENIPVTLTGDELRIKQILNNLLSNAFKYTHEGQIELMLTAEPQRENPYINLIFRISDTGQGMTEDQVRQLGSKFSRFNMEANRKTEGTGLGMNITQNLIHLMNGDISVESTPGMGTVFTVRLPQGCVSADPIGKELAENLMKLNVKNPAKMRYAQIIQEFMPYGRVLVVDDVETNLYVARGLLAPYGISIDTALSGFEAIEKIREGSGYDIVFMDHMMPRMDGIEAAKIIRSLGYRQPIVALTANALAGQAEMFLNSGFNDFISKPIDIRQLNSVLNKLIRDKQPPEVLEAARKQRNNLYAAGGHNIAIEPQLADFFVRDAKKVISVLNAISGNNYRRSDDIAAFIINVHAMKSALANIGESGLSEKAARLEQAGRDHNVSMILSSLPPFLESLEQVIDKLTPLEEDMLVEEDQAPEEIDDVYLREKIHGIQAACASYDKKSAKAIMTELKKKACSPALREQLSAIAEHLLHSEFEEAAAVARDMYFS